VKSFVRLALPAAASVACLLSISSSTSVSYAKNLAGTNNVSRRDAFAFYAQTAATTTREKREQAYAKLLEGQRRLIIAGNEPSEEAVRAAKNAFQQAAALDPTLAEARTALAEISFFASDLETAISEATAATRIDSNSFGAHRLLSRIYAIKSGLNSEKIDKSFAARGITEALEITRLDPTDAEAWALLAEFYQATGRANEAIDALTKWAAAPAAIDPRFFQFATGGHSLAPDAAAARLGEALLQSNRNAEAIAAIRRAVSLSPGNKEYVQLLGRAFEAGSSNSVEYLGELKRLVAADESNIALVQLLARTQARANRVDDAVATLRNAAARVSKTDKADQDRQQLRLSLAQLYADAARYDEAIAVYQGLLKDRGINDAPLASPNQRELAAGLFEEIITLQKSAGRTSDALATIERMRLVLGAIDPLPDAQQIELLRGQGKRREAYDAAHAARLRFPKQPQFLSLEAQTLTDIGRVDEAVALLRLRLNNSPQDFLTYRIISALYTQAGRGREAVEAARKTLEIATASGNKRLLTDALIALSSAQERAGDPKSSEDSLRRVLAQEPDNATALNNLGYFLIERNDKLPEALSLIQGAVRAEPYNSSYLDSLGWAYFKLGKLDEAERNLIEAAKRDSSSTTIQEHLGDLYERQGKNALARAAWQKALALAVEPTDTARLTAKLRNKLQ
jgi:predicted Zn-dependent protease